jgi:2-polyprenyl-3-methyl-5-hydroxy-6-metoxy-1,4-benzoquinol methylase
MNNTADQFSKGMANWKESFDNSTIEWDRFQFSQFKKHLAGDILEVGAGYGRMAYLTRSITKVKSLTLIEPSPIFYSRLQKNFAEEPSVIVINDEIQTLVEKKQNHYDVVYLVHVLEHIDNDKDFVKCCLEVVKPGGKLIVAVPALPFLYSALDLEIGHFRRYNKSMMKELFKDLNVRMISLQYSDFLGVFGSLIVSKIGRMTYKNHSHEGTSRFVELARFYSKAIVPICSLIEKGLTPPIGLNLTLIAAKTIDSKN